jgi:ribose transport system permease protein
MTDQPSSDLNQPTRSSRQVGPGVQQLEQAATRGAAADAIARYGLVIVTILVIVLFSLLLPNTYFTTTNFEVIATNQAPTLLLSLAILLPLISGEFDLSVAANFGFCELLVAGLMVNQRLPWGAAFAVTLVVGGAIGLANGVLVVVFKLNSFIATLGTATVIGGLTTWYSGGQTIVGNFSPAFLRLGSVQLFGSLSIFAVYALVLALVIWLGLSRLSSGRHLYATGGGRLAAVMLGLRTHRLIVGAFVLCGTIAAFTAVITASQLTSGQPDLGAEYLLPAYAGAFLGATTINIGLFNVWGTVIGVYLLGAGVAGLQELGVASYIQDFFNGGALLIAVAASGYVARRRAGGGVFGAGKKSATPGEAEPDQAAYSGAEKLGS